MELPGPGDGAEAGIRLIKLGFNPWHSQEEPPKPLGMAPNTHPSGVKQKQEQDWVGSPGDPTHNVSHPMACLQDVDGEGG